MHWVKSQQVYVGAVVVAIAVFAGAVLAYISWLAVAAALAVVGALAFGPRRRIFVAAATAAIATLLLWGAFGTLGGYFWLNRGRLNAAVAEVDALPAGFRSMEVGDEEEHSSGERFDSYRFLNGTAVTIYREQAEPAASQPVLYVDDVLRSIGATRGQYDSMRSLLAGLSLSGFDRAANGEVRLALPIPGGTPWGEDLVYRPAGSDPDAECVEYERLDRQWWWRRCG